MGHSGYSWSIRHEGGAWRWRLSLPGGAPVVAEGVAPSRAVAAALVVRSIARGVVSDDTLESLAA